MGNLADVLIIGAGMAGLTAAQRLRMAGVNVRVLDKARGVGGRMATRRAEGGRFDHGAQYFTARDNRFRDFIEQMQNAGVVQVWSTGFRLSDGSYKADGENRYRGARGMTDIPKFMAQGLDIALQQPVQQMVYQDARWHVTTESGTTYTADAVLMTAPVPQALAILDKSDIALRGENRADLEAVSYDPCFAIMALTDGPSQLPDPGGMWLNTDQLAWVADNYAKGVSEVPCITLHASANYSQANLDTPREDIAAELLNAAQPYIGVTATSVSVQRWLYSSPAEMYYAPTLYVTAPGPLAFAGDAFNGPRVEGAALSGLAAAEALLA